MTLPVTAKPMPTGHWHASLPAPWGENPSAVALPPHKLVQLPPMLLAAVGSRLRPDAQSVALQYMGTGRTHIVMWSNRPMWPCWCAHALLLEQARSGLESLGYVIAAQIAAHVLQLPAQLKPYDTGPDGRSSGAIIVHDLVQQRPCPLEHSTVPLLFRSLSSSGCDLLEVLGLFEWPDLRRAIGPDPVSPWYALAAGRRLVRSVFLARAGKRNIIGASPTEALMNAALLQAAGAVVSFRAAVHATRYIHWLSDKLRGHVCLMASAAVHRPVAERPQLYKGQSDSRQILCAAQLAQIGAQIAQDVWR